MGGKHGPQVRNALVYNLRARDSAVLDFHDALKRGALHWCEPR